MKISSSSIAILVITMAGTSVDAASCSVPTINTEADCVSFCQSDETSYFNGEAMVICQCIGAGGGLYSTYGDECTCPNTLDTCDGAGGESSTNGNSGSGSLPTWCYDIPEKSRSNVPECVTDGYPTWCADVDDIANVPVCGGTATGTSSTSNIQNTDATVPTWCNNIPEPGRSNVPQCVASGKYPTWCSDVGDTTWIAACGGTGLNSGGMPAWCDSLDAKAKMCIVQCGGAFTSSCCDGMDAQTRQYVVGCNGESVGGGGGGMGGGGGGMGGGGGGGGGGTSNAAMATSIGTSIVLAFAASIML